MLHSALFSKLSVFTNHFLCPKKNLKCIPILSINSFEVSFTTRLLVKLCTSVPTYILNTYIVFRYLPKYILKLNFELFSFARLKLLKDSVILFLWFFFRNLFSWMECLVGFIFALLLSAKKKKLMSNFLCLANVFSLPYFVSTFFFSPFSFPWTLLLSSNYINIQ